MANRRLCIACKAKHQQYATRPYCSLCAKGKIIPIARRVQGVDQFRTPPPVIVPVAEATPRFTIIDGQECEIYFSGADTLRGKDTPRNFGSSLLDTSRIIR